MFECLYTKENSSVLGELNFQNQMTIPTLPYILGIYYNYERYYQMFLFYFETELYLKLQMNNYGIG